MDGDITTLALAFDGMTATVSGVEFAWRVSCWSCKERWEETAPGGRVQVGLHSTTRGYRWNYERDLPPRRLFASPGTCPRCGLRNGMLADHDHPEPLPVFAGQNRVLRLLIGDAYRHLRAAYPKESAKADEAMQAEARRNAWNAPIRGGTKRRAS
jgi:hypothetical protein